MWFKSRHHQGILTSYVCRTVLCAAQITREKVPLSRANQVGARFRALPRPLLICSTHIAVSRILTSQRLARKLAQAERAQLDAKIASARKGAARELLTEMFELVNEFGFGAQQVCP